MADTAYSLWTVALLALAAYGAGRPLARALGPAAGDRLEQLAWSLGWGLLAWGVGLMLLGFAGLLYAPLIGVATWIVAFGTLGQIVMERRSEIRADSRQRAAGGRDSLVFGLGLLVALALLPTLAAALVPPTAGDALCYHLELPKQFLEQHRLLYLPDSDNSTFPLLTEMWFLWALALDGGVAAQLTHALLGLLLGLATVDLARPIVGRRGAWLAACVVMLVPGVSNQMTAPLADVACAACTTLAMAAWWRAVVEQEPGVATPAGCFLGAALAVKYIALLFAAALAVVWIAMICLRRTPWKPAVQTAATLAVLAATVAGPWYARAAWHRGNPVWPFLGEVAGSAELPTLRPTKTPLGHSATALLVAPWQVTMQPERFGGRAHQLGPLFLMLLPGLVFARRLRGLGLLLGVAGLYAAGCLLLRQNVRFLLPAVPLLAAGCAWVLLEMRRIGRPAAYVAWAVVLATAGLVAIVPAIRLRHTVDWWANGLDRHQYLLAHEPTYPMADVCNQLLPAGARLLSQEQRAFYFQAELVRENIYRRRTHYDRQLTDPSRLVDVLRSAGFTHLLLAESLTPGGIEFDPTLNRLVAAARAAGCTNLPTLCELSATDGAGDRRRYQLIALEPGS